MVRSVLLGLEEKIGVVSVVLAKKKAKKAKGKARKAGKKRTTISPW
ncbi:MAG: hypothetical protein WCC94_05775 [Candidatus Bathyarchaeia archaeon]